MRCNYCGSPITNKKYKTIYLFIGKKKIIHPEETEQFLIHNNCESDFRNGLMDLFYYKEKQNA